MTDLYEPVTVVLKNGKMDTLSAYLDRVELPIRLEPLISGLFKRSVITEDELKNYILSHPFKNLFDYQVTLNDGTQQSILDYDLITTEQTTMLFAKVLIPYNIANIYEQDLFNFIKSLEQVKPKQRVK